MYHDTCDPSIISCQFFPVYHIPKMSDKKLFRQIFNFYKKTKKNEFKPSAKNLILVYTGPTVKT